MRFGVFKDFFAEAILYKFNQLGPGCRADAWARGSERDDEFAIFTHDAERPDATVEGFVFRLQDAAFVRVQEGAGNFFFGVVGAVAAKDDLTVAELPHYAVFVSFA